MNALAPIRRATLLLLVFATAACGSSSSPTEPPDLTASNSNQTSVLSVATEAGVLAVADRGCGDALDLGRMGSEIDTTMRVAVRQNPGVFASGFPLGDFEIHARPRSEAIDRCNGAPACFEPNGSSGRLHVQCDGAGVEHEAAHALTWATRLDCWQVVYHSTNFRCETTSNMYGS